MTLRLRVRPALAASRKSLGNGDDDTPSFVVVSRISWNQVPLFVRERLIEKVGAVVVAVHPAESGYSPAFAGSADLDDGRRVFIKAVSDVQNPDTPGMVCREAEVADALADTGVAPRLLAVVDEKGWVAGVFEHVEGAAPGLPWEAVEFDRAVAALGVLNGLSAPGCLPTARDVLGPVFNGWRRLSEAGGLDDTWATVRLRQLVALEDTAVEVIEGDRLVHNDVRADNMLVDQHGEVRLVDWAHACAGPGWLDLVLWLPALQLEGGGTPDEVLARVPEFSASDDEVTAVHAASTGYFLYRSTLPDPPGLPTVRRFQRDQGRVALRWLKERLS